MENYSYASYADSADSSPGSRDIEENPSWEENPSNHGHTNNYRVKFMCSYGGKIQPRSHDNQLAYVGGQTKILAVDRTIDFSAISYKLYSLCGAAACFKYQLLGEDLDALISVTNDEDLEHMMLEYDRLHRASAKPTRLRLFLFPLASSSPISVGSSNECKSERQWFVDALNNVQIQTLDINSPPAAVMASNSNIDFPFGFDKSYQAIPPSKLTDPSQIQVAPDVTTKDKSDGSDCVTDDRTDVREPAVSPSEIQRQIQELRRLQLASQEQSPSQRKIDEANPRAYTGDFSQKLPERISQSPAAFPGPVQMPIPSPYLPERHMTNASGYPISSSASPTGPEQHPIYLIPTANGLIQAQAIRPVTGPVGPAYYGMQRVIDGQVYKAPSTQANSPLQQPNVGGYHTEDIQMMQQRVGAAEQGYAQVVYDGIGRQVYYTAAPPPGVVPSYQTLAATVVIDGRQGGGAGDGSGGGVEGMAVPLKVSQASGL